MVTWSWLATCLLDVFHVSGRQRCWLVLIACNDDTDHGASTAITADRGSEHELSSRRRGRYRCNGRHICRSSDRVINLPQVDKVRTDYAHPQMYSAAVTTEQLFDQLSAPVCSYRSVLTESCDAETNLAWHLPPTTRSTLADVSTWNQKGQP